MRNIAPALTRAVNAPLSIRGASTHAGDEFTASSGKFRVMLDRAKSGIEPQAPYASSVSKEFASDDLMSTEMAAN